MSTRWTNPRRSAAEAAEPRGGELGGPDRPPRPRGAGAWPTCSPRMPGPRRRHHAGGLHPGRRAVPPPPHARSVPCLPPPHRRVPPHEPPPWCRVQRRYPGAGKRGISDGNGVEPPGSLDCGTRSAGVLAVLPWCQRAVVVLRYDEDLPEQRVAEVLGCSVPAAHIARVPAMGVAAGHDRR